MNQFAKPGLAVDQLPSANATDAGKALVLDEHGEPKWGEVDALPAVTSSDNGKVLTVESGAWAAAEPTPFVEATLTASLHSGFQVSGWTINKTYAELSEAVIGGTPVKVNVVSQPLYGNAQDKGYVFAEYAWNKDTNLYAVKMTVSSADNSGTYEVYLNSNDTITSKLVSSPDKYKLVSIPLAYDYQFQQYYNSNYTVSDVGAAVEDGVVVQMTYDGAVYHLCHFYHRSGYNEYSLKFACVVGNSVKVLSTNGTVIGGLTIQLAETIPIAGAATIQLTESSGNLINSSTYASGVDKYTKYYVNVATSGAEDIVWYSTVEFKNDNVISCNIIIKNELTNELYSMSGSPYGSLSFAPYTPTP